MDDLFNFIIAIILALAAGVLSDATMIAHSYGQEILPEAPYENSIL